MQPFHECSTVPDLEDHIKSTIDKIAKAIDDPELIQELYDATGYSSKKIRERKKIIADNGFSLDLSTVQVHEKNFFYLNAWTFHDDKSA